MRDVCRAGDPPPAGEYVPLLRIRGRAPRQLLILSPFIWGFHTHWVGGRTVECSARESDLCRCPYIKHPQKWYGVLRYYEFGEKMGFVELTSGVANKMLAMLQTGQNFRGLAFKFSRSSDGKGARHYVERIPHVDKQPDLIPPDEDPKELLLKLWGAPKRSTC